MGKCPKEIIVWDIDAGLYIMEKANGTYGLTNKSNATKFSSMRAVKAAINWCRWHIRAGIYRHLDLRKEGKEPNHGNGI